MKHEILGQRRERKYRFVRDIGRLIEEDTLRREREGQRFGEETEHEDEPMSKVSSIYDYLVIPDIQCTGADGKVFERYDMICVAKDVERDGGIHVNFSPYRAISHFEGKGMFLPSYALSCNVLAYLFANKNDKDTNKVLMQYKDNGSGYGWHAQNTVIDWKERKIRHYPLDVDFPNYGGNDGVNQSVQRNEFGFKAKGFGDMALEDALKEKHFKDFIINLTGLPDPNVLVEIGKYFDKLARIWVPNNPSDAKYASASWLGCYDSFFCICANNCLSISNAARGVREP